jgi:hypothetical protein
MAFRPIATGRLGKKGAVEASFATYKSTDGVSAQHIIEEYESPKAATREMQEMVSQAVRVIERTTTRSAQSNRKGERFVLLTRRWSQGAIQARVVWTKGPYLEYLESPSLKHVLALEQQLYPDLK